MHRHLDRQRSVVHSISDRWGFLDHYSTILVLPQIVISTRVQSCVRSTMLKEESLPFWKVNVPQEQWPSECPDFLRNVSEKDQRIIGTPDEEYKLLTWGEVQEVVSTAVQPRVHASVLTAADRDRSR